MQAHFAESLTSAVNACLLHSRHFSSSSLGTNEVVVQPSPSTSYLASDDGVSTLHQCTDPSHSKQGQQPQYDLIGSVSLCYSTTLVTQADLSDINMTPREVVERLDKYIVGQASF